MKPPASTFDLGLAWNWEFDKEFVDIIGETARAGGITICEIQRALLGQLFDQLKGNQLRFRVVLDRASDEEEAFHSLAGELERRARTGELRLINPYGLLKKAADKATMHLELLAHGVQVPYTIIISPYNQKQEIGLTLTDLAKLGRPFIIKPANTTGGGLGVVLGAETLKDIIETRQHHKNDKYLLQEAVKPGYLSENRGWFRVFYAFGSIIPCWWDDKTHLYEEITIEDEKSFGLGPLRGVTGIVQRACGLDFFSTEIVFTRDERFVVVDYVNEMCDMRLQSKHRDGVPDRVVRSIASSLIKFVAEEKRLHLSSHQTPEV